jgi:steroid 5-alpha reductase family enzyme
MLTFLRTAPTVRSTLSLAFGAQALAYAGSTLGRDEPTEHYYDISGSCTHLLLVTHAVIAAHAARGRVDARVALLAVLSAAWAARLGFYLFDRVSRIGGDARFDALKRDPASWPIPWALQGVWCAALQAPVLVAAGARAAATPLARADVVGAALFLGGLALEAAADAHKDAAKRAAPRAPVTTGPFAWCVYPHYFGEAVLWCGAAALAAPAAAGAASLAAVLAAPAVGAAFVLGVSGVPLAEAAAWRRYGRNEDWLAWRARTNLLLPAPPGAAPPPGALERARARGQAAAMT